VRAAPDDRFGSRSRVRLVEHVRERRSPQGDRSPDSLKIDNTRARDADPNVNIIIREPGHVEYASTLGLGVYDRARIKVQNLQV